MRIAIAVMIAVLTAAPGAFAQVGGAAERRKVAGNHFLQQQQYEQARDQYLAALQLEPAYADAHYNLGVIYFFRLRDYPRALYHFVEYARLRPDAEDTHQVRSLTIQALEKVEAAERKAYEPAVQNGTAEALQSFLTKHPEGYYAQDAEEKLHRLQQR